MEIKLFLKPEKIITHLKNIAGVDIPVFDALEFSEKDQDIDSVRLYFDSANFVPDSKGQKYVITGKTVSGKTSPCKTLFLKYNNYGYEEIFAPEPKVC